MDIHEYQAKQLMGCFEIPTSEALVVKKKSKNSVLTEAESKEIDALIDDVFSRCDFAVIKAQVHAGGRGKAGGVKLFKSKDKNLASEYAKGLIGKQLVTHQTDENGQFISAVYAGKASDFTKELYLSAILNREFNCVSFIVSTEGGMDIEEVSEHHPEKIHTINIEPINGYQSFYAKDICNLLELDLKKYFKSLNDLLGKLYKMLIEKDISLLEINPLVIKKDECGNASGEFEVLDAKVSVDDNALWRQKDLYAFRDETQEDALEIKAHSAKLSYVKLDGNIGCMVNGAGLAMATMDIIQYYGGSPANFLDVGGGASKEGVKTALDIIFNDERAKTVLINIFGGIVRCDMIAEGLIAAVNEIKSEGKHTLPIVIRLSGTNSEEGMKLISESGLDMTTASNLDDAASKAVQIAKKC